VGATQDRAKLKRREYGRRVNDYLLQLASGGSSEIQAESYERDGDEWVFYSQGEEVARVLISDITSIARSRA
jgi:hypothetical protein